MKPPLVAIVGAPNVGKSTLFNRLVGRRHALVTDEPGMTRDRLYGIVDGVPVPFRVVDTGGLTPGADAPFSREIERQATVALDEADLTLFVVDARAGLSALELELASKLRIRDRALLLVANKVDGDRAPAGAFELHRLGLGEPIPISAEHGLGIDALLERIEAGLDPAAAAAPSPDGSKEIRVALVGRPNVGKSSILNRLVGEERVMVSDVPGTTRDAIDTVFEVGASRYRLIDTAGLRRPGRIRHSPEYLSTRRARQNIERCDVAVLVLDATDELAAQDAHIAGHILRAYRPLVVAVNKWDLAAERETAVKTWEERVRYRLRFAKHVPVLFVSARTGQRVLRLLDAVERLHAAGGIEVPTPRLNRWLRTVFPVHRDARPPRGAFRLYYATQTGVRPPTFTLFCNDPARAHFSLRRRIENGLRESFGFDGVPLRLRLRRRRNAGAG